jgi:hypothetical protein
MEHPESEVHPELRSIAGRIPKFSVTSGNLWLWHLLTNLRGASKIPEDILMENILIPGSDQKSKIRLRVYRPGSAKETIVIIRSVCNGGMKRRGMSSAIFLIMLMKHK